MKLKYIFSFLITISFFSFCEQKNGKVTDLGELREGMVKEQIEARGIKNPKVLVAMRKIERHKFVLPQDSTRAYDDYPLPIGEGQSISQPYIVGLMTETLNMDKNKKVLEIGTGSGYQTAVLAEMCDSIFTIEIYPTLGEEAQKRLKDLGYKNIFVKIADGFQGWAEHAPFDAIIVTCAPTKIPQPLQDQLAEGGKMIIPVGKEFTQELYLLTKEKGAIKQQTIIPVRFVPMLRQDGGQH